MSNRYENWSHGYINDLLRANDKKVINKNNKINDNGQKYKLNIINEKKPVDNINYDKLFKESKITINEKKEKENEKFIPTLIVDKKSKSEKLDNYNEIVNLMLSQKETKLLTDSQYVSFENQIGDNSCYINVIMHFLYIFPCVNDFLIKKYKEKIKDNEKEKEKEKEKDKDKENEKLKEEEKEKEKEKGVEKEKKKEGLEEPKKDIKIETPKDIKEIITKNPDNGKPITKKKTKEEEYNDFLFNLGKLLNSYQEFLAKNDMKKKITELDTRELRKSLSICSDNKFRLNCISDPVEFLIYILELINKENSDEIHLYFHLKLIEEMRCTNFCPVKSNKRYDKDNFIYQIYVEEIFNYIKNQKLKFLDFKEKLFMLSYYSLQNELVFCEKCKTLKNKILICNNEDNSPKFLLVNCVWNNAKPDLTEVIQFLHFISLIEQIDNLFICSSRTGKTNDYCLIGMIFYSFTLCHYINLIFNVQKNVFTLYNDNGIMEFKNLYDVYRYITEEQLKKNNKAYFYPVLLVYCKESIYEEKRIDQLKYITKLNYEILLEDCEELIKKEIPKEKPLTEEEKRKNYNELLLAQIKYERGNFELNNYNKENDDIFNFLRKERDHGAELKKINIVDNDQKKIKSNNFLLPNKNNKKVNRSSSSSKQNELYRDNGNKIYNPYNIGLGNNYSQKTSLYGSNLKYNYK